MLALFDRQCKAQAKVILNLMHLISYLKSIETTADLKKIWFEKYDSYYKRGRFKIEYTVIIFSMNIFN